MVSTSKLNSPSEANMSMNQASEAEVSLLELWIMIYRRRMLGLVVFVAVVLLASAYLYWATPLYQSRAVIAVGHIPADRTSTAKDYIEAPDVLVARLQQKYKVEDHSEGARDLPLLERIEYNKLKVESVITLVAVGKSPESAQTYLQSVVDQLLQEHQSDYQAAYQDQEFLIKTQQDTQDKIDTEAATMSDLIQRLKKSDPVQAAFLVLERSKLLERRIEIDDLSGQLALELIQAKPTRVLRNPTLSVQPQTPKYYAVLVVAVVVGVVLGLLATLLVEFFARAKRELDNMK